jgi:hypothetical protein
MQVKGLEYATFGTYHTPNPSSVGANRSPNHYDAVRPVFPKHGISIPLDHMLIKIVV